MGYKRRAVHSKGRALETWCFVDKTECETPQYIWGVSNRRVTIINRPDGCDADNKTKEVHGAIDLYQAAEYGDLARVRRLFRIGLELLFAKQMYMVGLLQTRWLKMTMISRAIHRESKFAEL